MNQSFLEMLRCPIDPKREAALDRDDNQLVCRNCHVAFPIKQGLPVLVTEEGELPAGCTTRHQLPCRKS